MSKEKYSEILERYKYFDDEKIKNSIQEKEQGNLLEDHHILNEIILWKINRMAIIEDDVIELLNEVTKRLKTPSEAITDMEVRILLEKLLECRGVRLPMASTFLHFYSPKVFPIIDQRAYRQLFMKDYSINSGVEVYMEYLERCIKFQKENCPDIPFEYIDKLLYQMDKESGNKIKY